MSYYVTHENSVLNINNAHLKVSGNVQTDVLKLGAMEFAPPASDVPGTVNFTNVTTGVTTTSNLNVGGTLQLGTVEVVATTHTLENTTALGNVTSNTIQFTNATTGIVTTGNVEVGGDLTVSGNVEVGTANLFVDTVNSRVGIGTTSASTDLQIGNTSTKTSDTYLTLASDGGSAYAQGIRLIHNGTDDSNMYGWRIRGDDSDDRFHINYIHQGSHQTSALTIKSGGDVGVGTSSPGAKLHIGAFDNNHLLLTSVNNDYGWKIDTDDQGSGEVPFRIYRRTNTADTLALSIANQNGRINHAHTEKYNFHWNPDQWGYNTNAYNSEINLWDFTLNVPYDGWVFVKCHAHWARYNSSNNAHAGGNQSFYAWLSVANRNTTDSANYDSFNGSTTGGYDRFHEYQSPNTTGAGSWRDFNYCGFYKVSAGNNTISLRVINYFSGGDYLNINGGGVTGFYMPRNYI